MYIKPFHIWIRWLNQVARPEVWYVKKEKSQQKKMSAYWAKNTELICVIKTAFVCIFRKNFLSDVGRILMPITNDLWYQELGD